MSTAQKPSLETTKQWHDDPKNWLWGVFYHNSADKRLFPPKRIPIMGWTVNFANPASYMIILGSLVLAFLLFRYLE